MTNRLLDLMAEKQISDQRPVTVAQVARDLGMSRQAVYDWINDKVTTYPKDTIERMCRYFNCVPGDLIVLKKGNGEHQPQPELTPGGD